MCYCLNLSYNKGCTLVFGMVMAICGVVIAFLAVNSMMTTEWMSAIYEFELTGALASSVSNFHISLYVLATVLLGVGLLAIPTVIKQHRCCTCIYSCSVCIIMLILLIFTIPLMALYFVRPSHME